MPATAPWQMTIINPPSLSIGLVDLPVDHVLTLSRTAFSDIRPGNFNVDVNYNIERKDGTKASIAIVEGETRVDYGRHVTVLGVLSPQYWAVGGYAAGVVVVGDNALPG